MNGYPLVHQIAELFIYFLFVLAISSSLH
jgi:hypothetical protein